MNDIGRWQAALEAAERRGSGRNGAVALGLAFESGIERDFLNDRSESARPLIVAAIILALLFYVCFLGYDALTAHSYDQPWIWAIILGFCAPFNVLILVSAAVPALHRYIPYTTAAGAATNGLGLTIAVAMGFKFGVAVPYEILIVQQLYNFFLLGLPWRQATPITAVNVALFIAMSYFAGVPGRTLFEHSYFLCSAALVSSIGCYLQERTQRLAWLRAQVLRGLSEHDALTGLYNRRVFFHRGRLLLQQAQREGGHVSLVLGDVDHFKKLNDSRGHLAGDECLRQVARVIDGCGRRPLDIGARIGGEEFALLLYGCDREGALRCAEELRTSVRALMLPGDTRMTISVGIATSTKGQIDETVESLVGRADAAMYRAKQAGRDRVSE